MTRRVTDVGFDEVSDMRIVSAGGREAKQFLGRRRLAEFESRADFQTELTFSADTSQSGHQFTARVELHFEHTAGADSATDAAPTAQRFRDDLHYHIRLTHLRRPFFD